jgi:hypothetical protein
MMIWYVLLVVASVVLLLFSDRQLSNNVVSVMRNITRQIKNLKNIKHNAYRFLIVDNLRTSLLTVWRVHSRVHFSVIARISGVWSDEPSHSR